MAFKKEVVDIIEPRDIFVGNKKAAITLEEFGEYENDACAKANEIVKQILDEYKEEVRFNFRHFPLTNIHQKSLKASEAAVAAGQEGKFWEMHNVLFANRRNLGTTSLKLHSREAGISNKRFLDDLVNATYGWQVQGDIREGLDRGIKTIPAFFVNGIRVANNTYEDVKKAIVDAAKAIKSGKAPVIAKKIIPAHAPKPEEVKPAVKAKVAPVAKLAKEAPSKVKAVKVAAKAAPKVAAKPVKKAASKPAKPVAKRA
jgi:predicted DsbA family dithiol-disulfide isomerase